MVLASAAFVLYATLVASSFLVFMIYEGVAMVFCFAVYGTLTRPARSSLDVYWCTANDWRSGAPNRSFDLFRVVPAVQLQRGLSLGTNACPCLPMVGLRRAGTSLSSMGSTGFSINTPAWRRSKVTP
jgi:hypothetical protein